MGNSFSKSKNPVEDDQASQRNKAPWLQDNISKREGELRKRLAWKEIEKVQNLVKKCMMVCMTRDETIATLRTLENINPDYTQLVWETMEKFNPDVFKAYYNLLEKVEKSVKDQIRDRASNIYQANSNSSYSGLGNPGSDGNVSGSANYFYSPAASVETPKSPGNEPLSRDLPGDSR